MDKTLSTNTDYETAVRQLLVIRKWGTDLGEAVKATVDGKTVGYLHSTICPMFRRTTNYFGIFDLEDLYVVIPPETPFKFESTSSGKVRVKGEIIFLEPGEAIPGELATRYGAQSDAYWNYVDESFEATRRNYKSQPRRAVVVWEVEGDKLKKQQEETTSLVNA